MGGGAAGSLAVRELLLLLLERRSFERMGVIGSRRVGTGK